MRTIAILASYNERRFIRNCLEHLIRQGLDVYLIDNDSEDDTVSIAAEFLGRGLLEIERFPRQGYYSWQPILKRKAEIAYTLDADWFLHADIDEIRISAFPGLTLNEAIEDVDNQGFNAINFQEFTFVPTLEAPDHDHSGYMGTMLWYYPFLPTYPHRVNAWKNTGEQVDLSTCAGHRVLFPSLRLFPTSFPMRHYLYLSRGHAIEKYIDKAYDPKELAKGFHRRRHELTPENIDFLSCQQLLTYHGDHLLNADNPLKQHPLFTCQ